MVPSGLPLGSVLLLLYWAAMVSSQSPVQTFFPASIPLSVRSPYLSAWQNSTNISAPLPLSWPNFWMPQQGVMGWAGKIRVDNQSYSWLGNDTDPHPFTPANVTNVQITPTRSTYVMQAGPLNISVTFLSPIEPADWVLQSLPFSYVSVAGESLDGKTHSVQLYSDISAEWVSGDRTSIVQWSQHTSSGSVYHQIQLQSPEQDVEINSQAQDGVAYYAMKQRPGMTWQIAGDADTRDYFHQQGTLANKLSNAYGPIKPAYSVFAIAVDLGQIQAISEPVTWAVGYVRDPSTKYTASDGSVQQLRPYYTTKYSDIVTAIDDITSASDDTTLQKAIALDEAIIGNASQVSSNYADLVSLSARQTWGSLDIAVTTDASGKPDPSDVRIFMKDIGSTARVNPVERIYAAMPAFLYLNASYLGSLLSPLLDAQDATNGQVYAAPDLGQQYPVASGDTSPHNQGIEQSGNMLIMLYAHARFSGDGSLLQQHYGLAQRWADYLVNSTLAPNKQSVASADVETTPNMTNLALKGIIGVKAMAEISRAMGKDSDARSYDSKATSLIGGWQSHALSSDQQHILGTYGDQQSWALMYNLYADRLLGTNVVDQAILQGQTAFYKNLLSSAPVFGLPIDSQTSQLASAAWTLFTAAVVQDNEVRNGLIKGAWNRASSNQTAGPFPSEYGPGTGVIASDMRVSFFSPAVGAMFSLLALNLRNTTITFPQSKGNKHKSRGAIAGGVVGGIAALALAGLAVFLFRRRQRRSRAREGEKHDILDEPRSPFPYASPSQGSLSAARGTETTGVAAGNTSAVDVSSSPNAVASAVASHSAAVPPVDGRQGSAKMRELEQLLNACSTRQRASSDPSPGLIPATGSSAGGTSASGGVQPSPGTPASSLSNTDVHGLRAEMENLRRVMQEMQAERLEPPPEYTAS
ncbi:hypothetical protein BD413DRAFT_643854 [Trametes elegans]|nr:hypothetical protein BD413DRAFT_643854 [Trametes elegans]